MQVQRRNQVLLGFECRRPVRGPSRGSERLPLQWPERRPQRAHERSPFRGQGLPQPHRGQREPGEFRNQNADTRSQNSWKGRELGTDDGAKSEARCQIAEVRSAGGIRDNLRFPAGLLSFAAAESQLISQSANRRLMRCSLSGVTWPMAPRNTRSSATASRPTRIRLAALSPLAE